MDFSEIEMKNSSQKYIAENETALQNGIRSFWINGFSSTFVSWQAIMTEWLTVKGNPARESVVANTRFGISYKQTGEFSDENIFLSRRENYNAELPEGVLILTAGVDVQNNRLEFSIYGWGIDEECYGILRGVIYGSPAEKGSWAQLDNILQKDFSFADGSKLKIARTFIDAGFSTNNVYDFCKPRAGQGVFCIKGLGGAGISIIHKSNLINGVILTTLGVDSAKSELFSRLAVENPGAGYIHFPHDDNFLIRNFDTIYFKQLIAEKRIVRRVNGVYQISWEPLTPHTRNECLDTAVYSLAALKSLKITDWSVFSRNFKGVDTPIKKTANRIHSREVDIWTN